MVEFVMPILGADMVAGTVIEWRRQPGERLTRGDIIAKVETDKGLIDVEVFVSGVLDKILVEPGITVPTGTVLALIREDAGVAVAVAPATSPPSSVPARAVTPVPPPLAAAPPTATGRVRVSPAARIRAKALGVDIESVLGTGPRGAVTLDDVEKAAQAAATKPPAAPEAAPALDPRARMRRTIAAAMARAKREIPHYYLATTIDMHRAMTWLAAENAKRPVTERLLPGVLLIKTVALALREVPELNARWSGDRVTTSEQVHVGVAIALREGGLVAPALHDTDRQPLDELMRAFRDLVQRARTGGLRSSELADPTITVTSLGERGAEVVFPIIYPPQVAIVGFGRIVERPWSVDGAIVSRAVLTATLAGDHRVSDGHRGGLLLAAVERLLQRPEAL